MKTLLITRPMPDAVMAAATARFDVTARVSTLPLDAAELRAALRDYDLVLPTLGDRFDAGVFADVPQPRARLLANFGVGYNHIDVAAARLAGVAVTNTPGAVTDATADTALTLILMTARRAGGGERLLRAGQWQGWHPTQLLGQQVTGRSLGVIGMGRIGQAIAARCHFGFGMTVRYATPRPLTPTDEAELGVEHMDLDELLAWADIISLHCPLTDETRGLISRERLAAMRPDVVLINTARGGVVDEAALVDALVEGKLGGAGLDVFADEPHVPEALRRLPHVVLTPHIADATPGAEAALIGHCAAEVLAALDRA